MQPTDSLIVHFLSFSSLLNSLLFIACENPPNKCAKMTRQINAPKWPAKISCRENLPDSPARITHRIYLPERPAISTRGLLARDPPFPAQNPQAGPGSPTLPPPRLRQWSWGEGAGRRPGPPTHIEQVLLLFFHISWMATYPCKAQYIHILHRADWMKYKYITVGEGTIARRGWGAGLLPAPLKGVFCIIYSLQEVSRRAILTRIGNETYIIFRYTLTNTYQHRII